MDVSYILVLLKRRKKNQFLKKVSKSQRQFEISSDIFIQILSSRNNVTKNCKKFFMLANETTS